MFTLFFFVLLQQPIEHSRFTLSSLSGDFHLEEVKSLGKITDVGTAALAEALTVNKTLTSLK
jgi:hypothetical protein